MLNNSDHLKQIDLPLKMAGLKKMLTVSPAKGKDPPHTHKKKKKKKKKKKGEALI